MKKKILFLLTIIAVTFSLQAQTDKYLWLEDIDGPKAMELVKAQSKITYDKLRREKSYLPIYGKLLSILNSPDRIAYPAILGKFVYNFWKDKEHERGIWQRCLFTNYVQGNFEWETLLDMDSLSEKELLNGCTVMQLVTIPLRPFPGLFI